MIPLPAIPEYGLTEFRDRRVPFGIPFFVSDDDNASILTFGIHPSASSSFDAAYDLYAPPPPPGGAFDARIRSNGEDYITEFKNDSGVSRSFEILYHAATGSGAIVLSWDPTALVGLGTFEITDNVTGNLFGPLDMSSTSSLEVASAGGLLDAGIRITYTPPSNNSAPAAINDAASTNEDSGVNVNVLGNDSDDGRLDPTSVAIVNSPARGTITGINASTGAVSFVPEKDFHGTTEFTYTVADDTGLISQPATVTITVSPVNDDPVFTSTPLYSVAENTQYQYIARTFDVDGDPITISADLAPAWLSVIDHGNGTATIEGVPGPQQQGSHQVVLLTEDNHGGSASLSFSIEVIDNLPPIATRDYASISAGSTRDIDILANDGDPEGDALNAASIVVTTPPAHGTLVSINSVSGVITYAPDTAFSGLDFFTYTVQDIHGGTSNAVTVEVTVVASNAAPIAVDDTRELLEDQTALIDVLANDSDAEGGLIPASVAITRYPTLGTISNIDPSTGRITYVPDPNASGSDFIDYTVRDAEGEISNVATVTIHVFAVNDTPKFGGSPAATAARGELFTRVLTATDIDGDLLSFAALALPAWLTLSDNGNNSATVSGTPSIADVGIHQVAIEVRDPSGSTASHSFLITVSDNAAPSSQNDVAVTSEDNGVDIYVLANDSDPEGDLLDPSTVVVVGAPSYGTIGNINAVTGAIFYIPGQDFYGIDAFTYVVSDATGSISQEATVTVTVTPIDDQPVAVEDASSTNEDQAVVVDLKANDFDVDGSLEGSLVAITGSPAHGSITDIQQELGTVTYIPGADFYGTDHFTYQIIDAGGLSASATVTIEVRPVNDPVTFRSSPGSTATPDREYLYEAEATDPDNDTIEISIVTLPGWLHLAESEGGRATLFGTPTLIHRGIHNVVLEATDGHGSVVHQSFVIKVSENAIPEGKPDFVQTDEDIPIAINVLGNDTDPNDDALNPSSVTVTSPPSKGIIQHVNTITGAVTYLPNSNFYGSDEFMYTVTDVLGGLSNAVRVEVTIASVNDVPIAAQDVSVSSEDAPVLIPVLYNDTDADNDLISVVGHTSASFGVVTNVSDGSFRYVPGTNFNGVDTFTYTVSDPYGAKSTGRVTMHVLPVNDPSEFVSTPETAAVVNNPYEYTIRVEDLDHDELSLSLATQPEWITFTDYGNGTALISGTPSEAEKGTHRVVVDAFDGTGTVRQIFSIIVGDATTIPPQRVSLLIPDAGTTDVPVDSRLTWEPVPGALTYQIQIATEQDDLYTAPIVNKSDLDDTFFDVAKLAHDSTYRWRVRASNAAGTGIWSDDQLITTTSKDETPPPDPSELPATATLHQNYPNPFNPSTVIPFDLSDQAEVTLEIYDVLGRRVATLVRDALPAGAYEITWDAGQSPSGLYIYRLTAGSTVKTKTLSLIR